MYKVETHDMYAYVDRGWINREPHIKLWTKELLKTKDMEFKIGMIKLEL